MHPLKTWLVEHAADVLSKDEVSADGRISYDIMEGKLPCAHAAVEFGETRSASSGRKNPGDWRTSWKECGEKDSS